MTKSILLLYFVPFLLYLSASTPPFSQLQGFGTDMPIKIYKEVVAVDQLSLHTYIQPHTSIRLKPNITINLKSILLLKQVNDIIIEGPATLSNFGIYIQNCTNIILHNLRIVNASIYGVLVYGSNNVVVNSLTILDASRSSIDQGKCIDVTEGATNVTISNTILGYTNFSATDKYKGMLIANFLHEPVTNVSVHHNIFYQNYQRSPEISTPGLFDMKNNIIYGFTEYGSRIRQSAYGNFEQNYYIGGKKDPMVFVDNSTNYAYVRGNSWKFNYTTWQDIKDLGTIPYNVPKVTVYAYSDLMGMIQKFGCQPQNSIQRQIKNNVLNHKDLQYFQ